MTVLMYDDFSEGLARMGTLGPYDPENPERANDMAQIWQSWSDHFPHDVAAKFVVSGVDLRDAAIRDFGVQMLQHNVLALPASAFYFQWDQEVTTLDGKERFTEIAAMFVVIESQSVDSLRINGLGGMIGPESVGRGFDLPFSIDLYGQKAIDLLNMTMPDLRAATKDTTDIAIKTRIEELLAFLSALAMASVEKDKRAPAPRLQAKRAKRGLQPLPEYVVLRLSQSIVESLNPGADRSSPRPHFRRGHIRVIYKGSDRQRVVPVAPSWVNAEPGQARIPSYKVIK